MTTWPTLHRHDHALHVLLFTSYQKLCVITHQRTVRSSPGMRSRATLGRLRLRLRVTISTPAMGKMYRLRRLRLRLRLRTFKTQLTRALLGGVWTPPSVFSRIAKIRRRAAPPGFYPPYSPSFPQLLWKFRPKAMWGQVTRLGQVTQLQNNFPIAPRPQCFRESYETFGIWWGYQCLQSVYLIFFISVTSGQVIFATSPL